METSRDAWVGGALRRIETAVEIATLHKGRSTEIDLVNNSGIEQTILQALSYGYSEQAVAKAASTDVEQIRSIHAAADQAAS